MVKDYAFISFFRALAAFWVLAVHCMMWGGWWGIPLPPPRMAVDLFMMISGYLMAANAVARDEVEPLSRAGSWLNFWLRRFFRIAPAYYLSLALAIVLSDAFLGGYRELQNLTPGRWDEQFVYDPLRIEYTPLNVLLHLSFLFGLHPTYSFSTFLPDWSLSLEMQFYFVFPALFLVMRKTGFARSAWLIGIVAIVAG
jgi:peptidoglycan/LPS O-acetylase OafA/YrhL